MNRHRLLLAAAGSLSLALSAAAPAAAADPVPARPGKPTSAPSAPPPASPLPILGTRLSEYPAGKGKALADKGCLQCHSADIPRQQRLTEKQWTAEVEKMMRWGAEVSESDKAELVSYLVGHFGPDNDRFVPIEVAPLSTSNPAH